MLLPGLEYSIPTPSVSSTLRFLTLYGSLDYVSFSVGDFSNIVFALGFLCPLLDGFAHLAAMKAISIVLFYYNL